MNWFGRDDIKNQFRFYLKSFSLKSEGVIAVFPKIEFMTPRDQKCVGEAQMAPCCSHTFGHYFSFHLKSLAQTLTEKMRFS